MPSPTNPIANFNCATYLMLKAASKIALSPSDVNEDFKTVSLTSFDPSTGEPVITSGWASISSMQAFVDSLQTQLDNASALLVDMKVTN